MKHFLHLVAIGVSLGIFLASMPTGVAAYAPLTDAQLPGSRGNSCGTSSAGSSVYCIPGDTCTVSSSSSNNYTGICAGASAQPAPQSGGGSAITLPNPLGGDSDFFTLLDRFINVLTIFAAPILVALITVAGFMYMFGGADPNKRTTAVKIMKYGIIGFIVIIFARAIAAIVQGVL